MKKLLTFLVMIILYSSVMAKDVTKDTLTVKVDSIRIDSMALKVDTFMFMNRKLLKLVDAMIFVESRGNDTISNKKGDCIGCLQETKTLVRDVNRILKLWKVDKIYFYKDRKNRQKSIEMFMIVNKYYNKNSNWEKIAKSWNQGMAGMYIYPKRAQAYWNLVKKKLV